MRLLNKLNESLVPLRHYDDHSSTVILSLFQYAPLDLLVAIYHSLADRREQRGDIVICSSVDLDGETASAAKRGPAFREIAVCWHEDDLDPALLQSLVDLT